MVVSSLVEGLPRWWRGRGRGRWRGRWRGWIRATPAAPKRSESRSHRSASGARDQWTTGQRRRSLVSTPPLLVWRTEFWISSQYGMNPVRSVAQNGGRFSQRSPGATGRKTFCSRPLQQSHTVDAILRYSLICHSRLSSMKPAGVLEFESRAATPPTKRMNAPRPRSCRRLSRSSTPATSLRQHSAARPCP